MMVHSLGIFSASQSSQSRQLKEVVQWEDDSQWTQLMTTIKKTAQQQHLVVVADASEILRNDPFYTTARVRLQELKKLGVTTVAFGNSDLFTSSWHTSAYYRLIPNWVDRITATRMGLTASDFREQSEESHPVLGRGRLVTAVTRGVVLASASAETTQCFISQ